MNTENDHNMQKSADDIARAYDSPSWWYDLRGILVLTFAYRGTIPRQLRFFGRNMGPQHLEVAVGSGSLLDLILKWRRRKRLPETNVVGMDYAPAMLAGAIHRFRGQDDVDVKLADVAALPFPDNTFDSINIANALHCFPDIESALVEVHRVLKPGGQLAVNVLLFPRGPQPMRWLANRINTWGMKKGILVTPYAQDDIRRRITSAGFAVMTDEVIGNGYEVVARK